VVSVRLDPRFKKVVTDGYNTLAVRFEADRVGETNFRHHPLATMGAALPRRKRGSAAEQTPTMGLWRRPRPLR
jgi:hypothetical protein